MSDPLKITLLGTGIPNTHPDAFGTATLVEAAGMKLLLDCGRGTTIRLGQIGCSLGAIDALFFSHYHSDHYAGLFDFQMTGAIPQPWAGRQGPLAVHGPVGIEHIVEGAWQAAKPDRDIRVADSEIDPETMRLVPHVYEEGVIFEKDGLKLTAIEVDHGEYIKPAFGFRIDYNGKVFVHSHDTRYNENLIRQAQGADVFVHEVAAARPETLRDYPGVKVAIDHHTSPAEVGRVFAQVRPRIAMLTHLVFLPPNPVTIAEVLAELNTEYDGTLVVAEDLMTILIDDSISIIPFHHGAK